MEFPDKDETGFENATQEFSFHTEKRVQPDLPTDLFSKVRLMVWYLLNTFLLFDYSRSSLTGSGFINLQLSIKSELKQNNGSGTKFHQAKVQLAKISLTLIRFIPILKSNLFLV